MSFSPCFLGENSSLFLGYQTESAWLIINDWICKDMAVKIKPEIKKTQALFRQYSSTALFEWLLDCHPQETSTIISREKEVFQASASCFSWWTKYCEKAIQIRIHSTLFCSTEVRVRIGRLRVRVSACPTRNPVVPVPGSALTTSWICFSVAQRSNPRPRV